MLIVITTFSGALRKWAEFPNVVNNIALFISMVIPVYLLFFFKNEEQSVLNKNLRIALNIFLFFLIALIFHPLNTTFYHGLFGFFIHLSFIGILISYIKNKKNFDSKKIVRLFFFILGTQLIIATIQYGSPSDSFINRYADHNQGENNGKEQKEGIAVVGDAVRVTGTFSYLGGYAALLFFFLLYTFYLAKSKDAKYFYILTPIIIYGSLLSGARASVGFTIILIAIFSFIEKKLLLSNIKLALNTVILVSLLFIFNIAIGDKLGILEQIDSALGNFIQRVEENQQESQGRLTGDLYEVFFREFEHKNFGVGLGSTYQGANVLFGTSEIIRSTPMEGELFRLVIEGGIFFIFFRWILIAFIFSYLDFPLLLKISFFIIFCIFTIITFNIYNAIYISLGIICLNQAYSEPYAKKTI